MNVEQLFACLQNGLPFEPTTVDGVLFRMDPNGSGQFTAQHADPRLGPPIMVMHPNEIETVDDLLITIAHYRFAAEHQPATLEAFYPFLHSGQPFMACMGGMLFHDVVFDELEPKEAGGVTLNPGDRVLVVQMPDTASYTVPIKIVRDVADLRHRLATFLQFVQDNIDQLGDGDEGDPEIWIDDTDLGDEP